MFLLFAKKFVIKFRFTARLKFLSKFQMDILFGSRKSKRETQQDEYNASFIR